jgi:hypothetical protein
MFKMLVFVAAALIGLAALLAACSRNPTRRELLSDQAESIAAAFGEVYYRLQVYTNSDVSNVLQQIDVEKGSALLNCPIHHVRYHVDLDTHKWRNKSLFATNIAMFCPIDHEGLYLTARFNGSFTPAKTYPLFQK